MHWLMKEGETKGKWEWNILQCFSLQGEIPFLRRVCFHLNYKKLFVKWKRGWCCRGVHCLFSTIALTSAIPSFPQSLIFASSGRSEDPNSFQGPTKATFSTFEILQDSFLLTSSYVPYSVSLDSSSCSPSSPTLPSNHFKYSHYCRFLKKPLLFCRPTA